MSDVSSLFDLVEVVRYADGNSGLPHLPIGTAQLIDVVELFLTRHYQDKSLGEASGTQIDWAAAVKLAPLFETDAVDPAAVESFAAAVKPPFDRRFKRELLAISASGLHFVPSS